MSVKFYNIVWLLFLGMVAICFLSGNMTPVAGVVIGFMAFGWVFMGMMVVLPTSIGHPVPAAGNRLSFAKHLRGIIRKAKARFDAMRGTWMSSSSIEVRRPKFH
jgi:hypothetical protein